MDYKSLIDLVSSVAPDANGCKLWPMKIDSTGYGRVYIGKHQQRAHRAIFVALYGEQPPEVMVRHRCDVIACVEPAHLLPGSHDDNMADMKERGRGRTCDKSGERNQSAKLTAQQVAEIRASLTAREQGSVLALKYGVTQTQISRIKSGKRWATQ